MRQRTIFVGVREDLGLDPVHPKPLGYRYSVRDALPWIVSGGKREDARRQYDAGRKRGFDSESPCETIQTATVSNCSPENFLVEAETDISRYAMLPPSRSKPGAFNLLEVNPDAPCGTVTTASPGNDLAVPIAGRTEKRKFTIAELKRICAFPDDFVLLGSYAQQWERLGNSVPPVMMRAIAETIRDQVLMRAP